jgi:hypothetical protein
MKAGRETQNMHQLLVLKQPEGVFKGTLLFSAMDIPCGDRANMRMHTCTCMAAARKAPALRSQI